MSDTTAVVTVRGTVKVTDLREHDRITGIDVTVDIVEPQSDHWTHIEGTVKVDPDEWGATHLKVELILPNTHKVNIVRTVK